MNTSSLFPSECGPAQPETRVMRDKMRDGHSSTEDAGSVNWSLATDFIMNGFNELTNSPTYIITSLTYTDSER